MPRVPVYDQQRISSRALPSPRVRAPGSTGMEQVGQAVRGVGAQVFDLSIDFRDRADQLRADRALLDFNARRQQLSTGENGVLLRQGENALDFSADWQDLERTRGEIAAGLANDRQRALFLQRADPLMLQTQGAWEKHSFQQFGVVYKETTDAQMQQALQEVDAAALEGPEAVERALQRVLVDPPDAEGNPQPGILRRYLTLVQGLPGERVEQLVEQFRKDGHLRALNILMRPGEENVEAAQAYLAQMGDQLGKEADPIRRTIEAEARKRRALVQAGNIVSGARKAPRPGAEERVDPNAALAALDALAPAERDAARPYVLQQIQDAERAWVARVGQQWDAALGAYNQGGLRGVPSELMQWLNANAPELEQRLRNDAERRWRQSKADRSAEKAEQRALDSEITNLFLSRSTEDRATVNIDLEYGATGISDVGLANLKRLQRAAIEDVEKGLAVREAEFRREGLAQAAGVISTNKKERERFEAELTNSLSDFRAKHNRFPDREEAQNLYDELLKIKVKRRIRSDLRGYQVRAEERVARSRETAEGTGSQPAPASSTPPPAVVPAPRAGSTPAPAPRLPLKDRALELRNQGLSHDEIAAQLNAEGY